MVATGAQLQFANRSPPVSQASQLLNSSQFRAPPGPHRPVATGAQLNDIPTSSQIDFLDGNLFLMGICKVFFQEAASQKSLFFINPFVNKICMIC
jgi:hypothetical protein